MYRRLFGGGPEPLDVPGNGFGALGVQVGGIFEMLMEIHGQQILIEAWRAGVVESADEDGCFNADPHPGNILLLEDGQTLGEDFGQSEILGNSS